MDELGVDVQVLIPSFFNNANIRRPELEVALTRSYNRWLADVWGQSRNRLRWAIVLPLHSIEHCLEEMEFGRKHGGVSIYMRGAEHRRLLSDPYFHPIYDKAQELDLAVSVHVGLTDFDLHELSHVFSLYPIVPVICAFHSVLTSDLTQRFPRLRFAFLEAGSQWVPFALQEAARATPMGARHEGAVAEHALRDNRLFVACQMDDDLPYILRWTGPDNLVIGTDFGHFDLGTDIRAHRMLTDRKDVDVAVTSRIVDDNARVLYGI
jgi:predicted TIM-barrel fold metal-dependent hydrolase